MIPRRIHQIYLSGDLPERLAKQSDDLRQRNPGWEYDLYDKIRAEAFIKEHYDERTFSTYDRINPVYGAARADLIRHLLVYKLGGVYLDIKSDLTQPLDKVLLPDDEYILTQWRNNPGEPQEGFGLHPELASIPGGEYQTYHLICAPGHPFSRAAIAAILRNIRHYGPWSGVGRMGVVRTTGPSAYTLAIHDLRATATHRLVNEEEIGAHYTIPGYDHAATFKKHYAKLTEPVVQISSLERWAQRRIEDLRQLKNKR